MWSRRADSHRVPGSYEKPGPLRVAARLARGLPGGNQTHDLWLRKPALYSLSYGKKNGPPGRTRTSNLLIRNQVPYPLSHERKREESESREGFEPSHSDLQSKLRTSESAHSFSVERPGVAPGFPVCETGVFLVRRSSQFSNGRRARSESNRQTRPQAEVEV